MDNIDTTLQTDLVIQKSERETALLRKILFDKLCKKIDGLNISDGITINILALSEDKVLFDMKGVEGFDHIEFKITQTGWGRNI